MFYSSDLNNDNIVNFFKRSLQFVGLWPKLNSSYSYTSLTYTSTILLVLLLITPALGVLNDISNSRKVSIALSGSMAAAHGISRFLVVILNKSRFHKALTNLKNPKFVPNDERYNFYIKKQIGYVKILVVALPAAAQSVVLFQTLSPIFDESKLPLPLPFPLVMENYCVAVYVMVYLFQTLSSIILAWGAAHFDVFMFALMGLATAQLEILREKIIHVGSLKNSKVIGDNYEVVLNTILKECVQHHIAIERYVDSLEETFTYCLMSQVILFLAGIVFLGVNLLVLPITSPEFGRGFSLLAAAFIDLGMFCVQANEITMQSVKLSDACYKTDWTEFGSSVRKSLFIIMERSKRPFILTAGKFAPLTRSTFLTVLQTAASYILVIMKLYSK